jgi:hypothetical protein
LSNEKSIIGDWIPEPVFALQLQEAIGYGSEATLKRWRRLNKIPEGFETRHIGRMPMWRSKETATAK